MTARLSLQNWLAGRVVTGNPAAGALLDSDPNNRVAPGSGDLVVDLGQDRDVDVVALVRWGLSSSLSGSARFFRGGSRVGGDVALAASDQPLAYAVLSSTRVVDRIVFSGLDGLLCAVFAGAWMNISVPPDVGGGGGLIIDTDSVVPVSGNAYLSYFPPLRRADLTWSNLTEAEAAAVYAGVDSAYRSRSAVFVLPDAGNIREAQTAVFGLVDAFSAPARTDEGVSGTSLGVIAIRAEAATAPIIPTEVSRYPVARFSVSGLFIREGASQTIGLSLTSEPAGDVTVDLDATPGVGLDVSPTQFTFTRSNWSVAQNVTVQAYHDGNATDILHVLVAAGAGLASSSSLNVNVYDDEITARPSCLLRGSTNGGLSFHGPSVIFDRSPTDALPDFVLRAVLDAALTVDVRVNLTFSGSADSGIRPAINYIDIPAGQLQADLPFPLDAPGVVASLRVRPNSGVGYAEDTRTVWVDWTV